MVEANPFVLFVANRLNLDPSQLPDATELNDAGNTFGAICVRLGLMTVFDIEEILDRQKNARHLRFGEIAVQMGCMTERQVQGVLGLQSFYRSFEQGTLLVMAGHLEMRRLVELWTEFAAQGPKR